MNSLRGSVVGARIAAAFALGALSGCTIEMVTPTAAPSPTETATPELPLTALLPTIAPADTDTATPSATATPDLLRPKEANQRIFYDPLDDNMSGWVWSESPAGSVGFSDGLFVFTLNASYTQLTAELPREVPDDLYVEATAQTLLCGEGYDTYGIMFRHTKNYSYRFAVTCAGQLRFERYKGAAIEGATIWKDTLGLLPGAPATNRIGVLMQGRLFRFFVGGVEVLTAQDPVSPSGNVGLFVHTEKSSSFSAGFEDLSVYTVSESLP
jgi:hypothetical protein